MPGAACPQIEPPPTPATEDCRALARVIRVGLSESGLTGLVELPSPSTMRGGVRAGLFWGGLVVAAGCIGSPEAGSPPAAPTARESMAAKAWLAGLRERFVLPTPEPAPASGTAAAAGSELDREDEQGSALLRPSLVERFDRSEGWLLPRLPEHVLRGVVRPATVRLPARVSGAFEVRDDKSGMRLSVTRQGATEAEAEEAAGWAVYRGGVRGGDVLHLVHAEGTEDFVHFASKPERDELRYWVDVSAVAGLRLVSNVLEFLDAGGDPRLRMTAPLLLDAAGEKHALRIVVDGCAYDESPAPPWGRPVVVPGATRCAVVVRWPLGVLYPLVVDPEFTSTGSLVAGRMRHTASALKDGRVLVVGGLGVNSTGCQAGCKMAEVWQNGSFAAAGELFDGRASHTASVLSDGRVLIVGGIYPSGSVKNTAEIWQNGVFSAAGFLASGRFGHTASVLAPDRVLVVGGGNQNCPDSKCATAEIWQGGTFSAAGSLMKGRNGHTASVLSDDRVIVIGGSCFDQKCQVAEIWKDGVFSPTGSMMIGRVGHTASVLSADRVLVVGGDTYDVACPPKSSCFVTIAEMWQSGSFSFAGSLATGRSYHGAAELPDGRVLIVGGASFDSTACPGGYCKNAEIWETGAFSEMGAFSIGRRELSASALPDGRVLVAGGKSLIDIDSAACPSGICNVANIWNSQISDAGKPCAANFQCGTGFCVDGVCCDSPCMDLCRACTQSRTGQPDGACTFVVPDTDPDEDCPISGTGTCSTTGVCDGKGACGTKAGQACGSPLCLNESTQQDAPICGDDGVCAPSGASACNPYRCVGIGCLKTCASDVDCLNGAPCIEGQCIGQQSNGKICEGASQCKSGFCVDGVCCESACEQSCFSCIGNKTDDQDGLCKPVSKGRSDPKVKCALSEKPCGADGTCNGQGVCTQFKAEGEKCGSTSCSGTSVVEKRCDGFGACEPKVTQNCEPYACDGATTTCKSKCSSSKDCKPGSSCNPQTGLCNEASTECADGFSVKTTDGKVQSCLGYACIDGSGCVSTCASDGACAEGYKCQTPVCVQTTSGGEGGASQGAGGAKPGAGSAAAASSPSQSVAQDSGCGCHLLPSGSSAAGAWSFVALAVAARRRRRSP